jgi:long-chain acyl-CoA synthetase
MDDEGYIFITGRQKSVIVLNNGKNIFPEEIEEYLENVEEICESVVVGRVNPANDEVILAAVVFPDFDKFPEGESMENIACAIKEKIATINKSLPVYKQIRSIEIRKTEFEKTSSKKIKRFLVK